MLIVFMCDVNLKGCDNYINSFCALLYERLLIMGPISIQKLGLIVKWNLTCGLLKAFPSRWWPAFLYYE